ncbi:ribosome biogenesis GTPase Era [Gemella bergeri ATCC 700627]|uniref:GTPase Era n=1 Tax=Gemella bergeri ATCC 700627 TaxID=1321820 RepID=U2Q9R8_9BACL|nr:ribosome biogenesis GTPase Era [Gemella bergeri ATCC 700627]
MLSIEKVKTGFITIIGRPNAGKSTLLNNILKQKIAIMSDKPQTTRNIINGVYTDEDSQIVFIDTPGIHKPKHKLGDYMMKLANSAIKDSEIVYLIINANEKFGSGDQHIINIIKELNVPTFLLINKIDLISPENLLEIIEFYRNLYDFAEIVPISALKSINVDNLLKTTKKYLIPSIKMYSDDVITDSPEYFVISEFIREKVLQLTEQEIPHSIAVVIDKISKEKDKKKNIIATIVVERKSQKGMIIGKQGKMIKEIGTRARKDIEILLGERVFLELWVKVIDNWRSKPNLIRDLGYRDDVFD